jgi:transposase
MLCWISIFGGLLIMMGHHARSEALFYYFRLEDQVPETHLLRLIDKHISFDFVRERLRDSYSDTGRPSIDPELLLRILLIGYLFGITSERKLVEELRMHLAWRWFTGLSFDQEIPHHSTFSKNRHGRFQESKVFEQLFEQIVQQCVEVGLVEGKHLSVDGSFVEANAAKESRIPREQLVEAAQVHYTLRQYLKELEQQNPVEEPVHEQEQVSTTDPDSTYATKGGTPARLGYYDNYLVDNQSCVYGEWVLKNSVLESILCGAGALWSEHARTTPFARPDVGPSVIAMTSTAVVQGLARRADIAIVFRFVRETLGTKIWAPLSVDTVAGPHIGSDVTIRQPL